MNLTQELQDKIRETLPDLDVVIGWGSGFDPLCATPYFISRKEEVDGLVIGPLCVQNLAVYLPGLRGKKVGIVVKGCDSRSVVELLQEHLINREDITLFGYPCTGVIDRHKVGQALGRAKHVSSCKVVDSGLIVDCAGVTHTLPLSGMLADKCAICKYPEALISDHFCGEKGGRTVEERPAPDLEKFEGLAIASRLDFWVKEMDRCLLCFACREACPLCVCRDHCVAQSRDPHWLSQEGSIRDKLMFQVIHAYHLAGRCTECGECQRACPMDIPILLLKKKMNKEIKEIFHYEAGIDPEAIPPLLSFKNEEETIREREW